MLEIRVIFIFKIWKLLTFLRTQMDGIFAQPPSLKISVFVVFNGEGKELPPCACVRAIHPESSTFHRCFATICDRSLLISPIFVGVEKSFRRVFLSFFSFPGGLRGWRNIHDGKKCLRRSRLFIDILRKTQLWEKKRSYKNGINGGRSKGWRRHGVSVEFLMAKKKIGHDWIFERS